MQSLLPGRNLAVCFSLNVRNRTQMSGYQSKVTKSSTEQVGKVSIFKGFQLRRILLPGILLLVLLVLFVLLLGVIRHIPAIQRHRQALVRERPMCNEASSLIKISQLFHKEQGRISHADDY